MRYLVIAVVLGLLAAPAGAQLYLELGGAPALYDIPPDGSQWHELYPTFCTVHIQDGYEDNGDAEVSICDVIIIGGTRYHVDWVGPTYDLERAQPRDEIFCEPTVLTGGIPIGEIWHEVAPTFCQEWEVLDFIDSDLDGEVSVCDEVLLPDGAWWHVVDVRMDITVTEEPSPVEDSTWSKIKSIFSIF